MAEVWKVVPSYPDILASSNGRILLPPSHAPLHNGGYRSYNTKPVLGVKKRARKSASHVYLAIWTRRFGNLKVHQLVCEAFHGPKPFPGAVVMHADENALNNSAGNLSWGTQKENLNAPGFKAKCCQRKYLRNQKPADREIKPARAA